MKSIHLRISGFLCVWIFASVALAFAEPREFTEPKNSTSLQESPSDRSSKEAAEKKEGTENRQKEAEETKRLTELFLRNQNVFLRKGELMVELNTFYDRNSRIGFQPVPNPTGNPPTVVAVVRDTRRFIDNVILARYGILTDGLELDVIAPVFVHAEAETELGNLRAGQKESGVGDVSAALRYQAWFEQGARPGLIFDVVGKSTTGGTGLTGTGTWNAGGGVTLLKTIDPVVFFGRAGYLHNFQSKTRDLGDIFEFRAGMGFSLNDRVSFNMQASYTFIQASTTLGLAPIAGAIGRIVFSSRPTEIMNVIFTTTVVVTKKLTIEPFVGVPLTDQSFTIFGLRLPYRF